MYKEHVQYLACPLCGGDLEAVAEKEENLCIKQGRLVCEHCYKHYPIISFIPRFVAVKNYAESFGFEWLMHKKTQYDSKSGVDASKKRFYEETQWSIGGNHIILEAGCGSGRFSPHALKVCGGGGILISFDYSHAVDASILSNKPSKNFLLLQANIFELPLKKGLIDKCFCFGVLQHTPDASRAIRALVDVLKDGGAFVCDHYPFNENTIFNTKYWVRPISKRIPHKMLYNFGKKYINFMWGVFKFNRRTFSPQRANRLNWRLLIPDYSSEGLSEEQLKEWAYLDFFDMLAPAYDKPILMQTLYKYLVQSGLEDVHVKPGYNGWEGRGIKPAISSKS